MIPDRFTASGLLLAGALALSAGGAAAADLPAATQKALKDLKLDASILKGLEAELKVPAEWVEAAKKEKDVVILGTWDARQFRGMQSAFNARYPFIKLNYARTSTSGRGIKVLIALREGRVIADVLTSIANATFAFNKAQALADLRTVPGFKNISPEFVAPDGTWASHKIAFRCMAYNTDKVKPSELPKQWDELVTNPRWRNGNLAVSNHPNNWLLNLWDAKGEAWGGDFMRRLYDEVKPQQRKEGMSSTLSLTVAGEFHANVPASARRAQQYKEKGAPIGYHCPEPVPVTVSQIVMLKQAPNANAARIFINWVLSREGQLVQYNESFGVPVHKDLQLAQFVPFSETILGKRVVVRNDAMLGDEMHKRMLNQWNGYWGIKADVKMVKDTGKVVKTARGGRLITIEKDGKTLSARVSGSRTEVKIGGKSGKRGAIKAGMTCTFLYPGSGEEAKQVACTP